MPQTTPVIIAPTMRPRRSGAAIDGATDTSTCGTIVVTDRARLATARATTLGANAARARLALVKAVSQRISRAGWAISTRGVRNSMPSA